MNLPEIGTYLANRLPIKEIPITWNATGYTSEFFNRWAGSPEFSGWSGEEATENEVRIMVELLQAQPGESLLDVCCGYGRHDLVFAGQYNLNVTGIDISPGLIATARKLAGERGLDIIYEVRHGKNLSWSGDFQYAIITDNSFSLFSPEDTVQVLRGLHRALYPGGRVFLDLDNKPFNCRYGTYDTHWHTWPDGLTLQEIYFHQDISVEVNRDIILKRDSDEIGEFIIFKRIYTLDEISILLTENGFLVEHVCGGWDLMPLADSSPKMLLVAVSK